MIRAKLISFLCLLFSFPVFAQGNDECLMCHDDNQLRGKQNGKTISLYVNESRFSSSVHSDIECVDCHQDIDAENLPHREKFERVECGSCHEDIEKMFSAGLHRKAFNRGDPLAPTCKTCHGYHYIIPVSDLNSAVAPLKIPFLCGRCHKEGTPVQLQRNIPQDKILQNYSLSIHGAGLFKKFK